MACVCSSRSCSWLFTCTVKPQGRRLRTMLGCRYRSEGTQAGKSQRQIPREKPAVRTRGSAGSGYPLLIIPITAFGLGTWQVQRREWKLNLIEELEKKMTAAPVSLPDDLEELKEMEYRRVKIRGKFDHSREMFIGPRANINEPNTMGSNRAANLGVHVVTPFKLSDRDETVLVNRGHVTFKDRPAQLRRGGQIEDEVEITGVVRLSDKKSVFEGDPLKDGYWLSRNVEQMADIAGTASVFIDADINSTIPGGPQGGQTRVTLRNEHLSYIITWYSLFVLTSYLWYKNYRSPAAHRAVIEAVKREHKRM